MSQQTKPEFGKLRSLFFPIYGQELRKFVPMFFMLFLVCFNYSVLRCMKDTLVVTSSGAEVIPFIKLWVMLPTAILLTYIFTKLSNKYSQEKVFYLLTSGFLATFFVFAFFLYPLRDTLHLTIAPDELEAMVAWAPGFKSMVLMCCNWTFTGFYVMSELWGSLVMSVLFWGFANEVTKLTEARRFYSVFSVGSNFAAIAAGQISNFLMFGGVYHSGFPFGSDAWEQAMMFLVLAVTFSGVSMMLIFRWMNQNVLNDSSFDELHKNKAEMKSGKKKLSIKDSFTYLSKSKYLLCIAIIVVGYNLVINLTEVIWKDQLRELYPQPCDFNMYMNNLTSMVGVVSTATALFMSWIIARGGWTFTACITPCIMLITSVGFFAFMFFQDSLAPITLALTGFGPLSICVFFGAAQNCLSKAAKYSVFDATKEMAFIPLDHEHKLKGKAAIDGVGSRLGKSGGAVIHQSLLFIFVTLGASAPYVAVLTLIAIAVWFVATVSLGKQFATMQVEQGLDIATDYAPEKKVARQPVTASS
ncbi:MAG: NTP/NDP exchange transporter [Chlamydiales bacterium]|nr:NTP/NDP exchange transporter [Chlamydiia bacterium]MCP5507734.1 NTP/NDP exchange transporter [Chlamydiales bacterium]